MPDFKKDLASLVAGELSKIEVSREDFFAFRNAWQEHPEKVKIVGEAQLGGRVIYTYQG